MRGDARREATTYVPSLWREAVCHGESITAPGVGGYSSSWERDLEPWKPWSYWKKGHRETLVLRRRLGFSLPRVVPPSGGLPTCDERC